MNTSPKNIDAMNIADALKVWRCRQRIGLEVQAYLTQRKKTEEET